ncbi:MAG: hypothetical protein IPJ65_18130 [Archangiaceae bacterium]|nr:hypothetical protein [Archangiaceae bacterium]
MPLQPLLQVMLAKGPALNPQSDAVPWQSIVEPVVAEVSNAQRAKKPQVSWQGVVQRVLHAPLMQVHAVPAQLQVLPASEVQTGCARAGSAANPAISASLPQRHMWRL